MVISLLFACHGAATVLGLFGGDDGNRPSAGQWPGWWAGAIQLIGGVLVFLGVGEIGTRVAALLNSGSMAYAYFTVHQKHAVWPIQNGGELSVLFCWTFLLLAITGPGVWTLSWLMAKATTAASAGPAPGTETT
ncbi:DoxX family protein [Streptomyces sp. V4-01]|uniref:DoxX family protein n=1 Tax=Actinacidiphila polyblastidii TaxID=3110430 RepID=A0ABU7PGY0_9ACTN|nr:DoxX family protein [Streptomyces sp. V4-01]